MPTAVDDGVVEGIVNWFHQENIVPFMAKVMDTRRDCGDDAGGKPHPVRLSSRVVFLGIPFGYCLEVLRSWVFVAKSPLVNLLLHGNHDFGGRLEVHVGGRYRELTSFDIPFFRISMLSVQNRIKIVLHLIYPLVLLNVLC